MRDISIFLVGVLVMSVNTFSAAARAETVLRFPDDQSIGTLKTRAVRPKYDTRWEANWSGWANTVEARGAVTLPAGHEAMLTISRITPAGLACLDAIPPDALANIHLHQCKLGDEDIEHIARVATLRMLSISSCEFDPASLAKLARLTKLRGIWFYGPKNGNAVAALAASLPALEDIGFNISGLTDEGVAHLAKVSTLRSLGFSGEDVTPKGYATLAAIPGLEEVRFGEAYTLDDACAAAIATIKSLRVIELHRASITDAGMAHFAGLAELRELTLPGSKITDAGTEHLRKLTRLERVSLPAGCGDASLRAIGSIRSLRYLHVASSNATDAGVAALGSLENLEELNLVGAGITNASADTFAKLTKLKRLWLQRTSTGDETIAKIARLPNLEALLFLNVPITDAGVAQLGTMPRLKDLTLTLPQGSKLRLELLAKAPALEMLFIGNELADMKELAHLRAMPRLERFRTCAPLPMTDDDLDHIVALSNLKQLDAISAKITDAGLAKLARLTKLESLRIGGAITDDGLLALSGMHNLSYVIVASEFVTQEGCDALKARVPSLVAVSPINDPSRKKMPKPGEVAPPIDVKTYDGQPWKLADQRGKVTLVYFWATWCGPCVASQPALRDHFAELRKNERFAMVSLSQDHQEFTATRYHEKNPQPWPQVYIGMNSAIGKSYGVAHAPAYFLVDPEGKVLSTSGDWNELSRLAAAELAKVK